MLVQIQRWDYPTSANEGLDSNKKWYEFQLVEDKEIEMSTDEIAQLIADESERGHYLCDTEVGTILWAGDKIYTFLEEF